jgi:uncharacterized protein DUF4440
MLDHIRNLEAARFSAMKAGDLDTLAILLDTELIYVHSNGRVDDREAYLDSLRQGVIGYESIEVMSERHWTSADAIVLTQSVAARMRVGVGAEPVNRNAVLTSVWRRNPGRDWTLVAMQSTADTQS